MISKNTLLNLVSRALATTVRRTSKRRKSGNSATEPLETRALLAVFTVTSTADTTAAGTLRHAIDEANTTPGDDEIVFDAATNGTEFDLGGTQFTITESLTITGNGASNTIIDAQLGSRIFDITNGTVNVTISGVTLKNGRVTGAGLQTGGAIRSAATGILSISSSVLATNTVNDATGSDAYGGAVFVQGGSLTVFGSTISGNTANWGGAIYAAGDSDVSITSSNVDGNFATNDGGAIYAGFGGQGDVTITGSTLENNTSQARGGAIRADNVTISGSTVRLNIATTDGGAIAADGDVTVTNSTVSENTSTTEGGAIHAGGNVTVTSGSTINDNMATGKGGAIFSVGSTEVTNSTLANNSTSGDNHRGGAIYSSSGAVTISQSTLSGNSTTGEEADGGAIYTNTGAVTISQSTLSGNSTAGILASGGAIFANSGAVTISQSTLSGNSTAGSSADGGAVFATSGAVTISQSTLSGNSTAGNYADGGAVFAYSGAVTISQSTLSGNSTAGEQADGGAIYTKTGSVTISQSTLTLNNVAQSAGGAIFSSSSPVTITNSIVAGNTANGTGPDVRKSDEGDEAFTVTNSLIGRNNGTGLAGTGSTPGANGNLIGGNTDALKIDPLLAPLANNGGRTQSHALLSNSPAINRGSNASASAFTTDQRGNPFPRIFATTVDMGAYERFTGPLVVSTNVDESDGNFSSGDLSLREAIILANSSPETNTITFATSTNGTEFDLSLLEMLVTDTLTLTGNGATNTVIDAQQLSRIFRFQAGDFTLHGVTLKNGKTTSDDSPGGAIASSSSGLLTIQNSTLSGNSTTGDRAYGGAIFANFGAVTISQSTLSGNSTTGYAVDGGAIYANSGAVTISQSTLSGNTVATDNADGGAVYVNSGAVTISQSTLSGNVTSGQSGDGGAVFARTGSVTISQSTLTLNNAQGAGGAIFSFSSPLTILNSIVAGNTDEGLAPDVFKPNGDDAFTVTNSLISRNNRTGLAATGTIPGANGNLIGGDTAETAINPQLAPLANNGGPTQTHALLVNSPAFNRGNNALAVDVTQPGNPALTSDQRGNPFARIFDTTVDMGATERFAGTLVVSTNVDEVDGNISSGDLSLREAILLANGTVGANTITFAPSTNGTEFDLTLLEMFITDTLTITGNGTTNTVIDAQQLSRIFNFQAGDFTLNGVTLKNGRVLGDFIGGGAIRSSSTGQLTVQNSTLSGNATNGFGLRGGAISATAGAVAVDQSTLSDNSTFGSYGTGGAIHTGSGALTISRSTLSGNKTDGPDAQGGAIYANSGTVTISQSTLSGNSTLTSSEGGAIYARFGAVFVSQSTLTFNNASQFEGGAIFSYSAPMTITNSIVAENTDDGTAPDVRKSPDGDDAFTVTNSLIGRNNGTGLTATGTTPGLNGNLIGGDTDALKINPQLATLANNGGPTPTHALLANSPAFNRGSNASASTFTTDQRGSGFARTSFGIVDMGAFESTVLDSPEGTTGADAFVLTYSATTIAGTVTVTVSTAGGPAVNLGTFPMNSALAINGLGGTDSVRIVGTTGADTFAVNGSTSLNINGASLTLTSIETRTLAGATGSDVYRFDADAALGLWTLAESGVGTDTIDLSLTTTVGLSLNLGIASTQVVHPTNLSLNLSSSATLENIAGGSLNDTLVGNALANLLNGNAGGDRLTGAGGSDTLLGGLGDDSYVFATAAAAEADTLTEGAGGGVDTISFATVSTPVTFSLATGAVQAVHTNRTIRLNSTIQFENAAGGSSNDVLTGNTVANLLNGNAGSDTLNGAGGSDTLLGGLGDDTYVFSPATTAEADTLTEGADGGVDTISFATITTPVTFSLGTGAVQPVHTNRTLRLNSTIQFENAAGGSAADTLTGNTVANILIGNAGGDTLNGLGGRDILIGGLGLDTLNGGDDEDILIAGRTASDALFSSLNRMQLEWTSGNSYATRITNLRAGVGSPAVSLKAKVNVRNDAGEDDSLIGGNNSDWYFRALDDVITGLAAGEVLDVL